ncbi:hypothetical protein D3C71_1945930 [compost metagenome]
MHEARLFRLDPRKLGGQLVLARRQALQLAHLIGDHFLRNPIEDIHREEGHGQAVEDAFLQFMACDGLAVTAAGPVEVVDRQALLAVGAAIAVLA